MVWLRNKKTGGLFNTDDIGKSLKITDRSKQWEHKRNEQGKIIGYRLNDNIEIKKALNNDFSGTSYDNGLYVNGKHIMSAGSGYTIGYLKELGGLYQDALEGGIKAPRIVYSDIAKEIYIKDEYTGKEYYKYK